MTGGANGTEGDVEWQHVTTRAVPAILVVRASAVKAFDDASAGAFTGSAFIVDKARGLVLSNRHLVTPGPIIADVVFHNKEEIDVLPIYRDPIHDFGFFRFDPSKLKHQGELTEIELDPEGAYVGLEIRVIGNDAGEKLSILPGTLARLDRPAPLYQGYSDFNTFYYCASSNTAGGSSGSPILAKTGKAVALNCGGSDGASAAFYLPLHRVKRALEWLQTGVTDVPRGTVQTVFQHKAFDEVHRRGLSDETEKELRQAEPDASGLLVIDQILPEGPADGVLEEGDMVLRVGAELCLSFRPLEENLDRAIEEKKETISMQVVREEKVVDLEVPVQNLHEITPDRFLSISSSVLHPLSYIMAKTFNLPCIGVYVACPGYMLGNAGVHAGSVIVAVGKKETLTIDEIAEAFDELPDGRPFTLSFFPVDDANHQKTTVVYMDKRWASALAYIRDDAGGVWWKYPFLKRGLEAAPEDDDEEEGFEGGAPSLSASTFAGGGGAGRGPGSVSQGSRNLVGEGEEVEASQEGRGRGGGRARRGRGEEGKADVLSVSGATQAGGGGLGGGGGILKVTDAQNDEHRHIWSSMVLIRFHTPLSVDKNRTYVRKGVGFVVDRKAGLVVVDKFTIPTSLGDARAAIQTPSGCLDCNAEVLFVHPVQNFSVVRLDLRSKRGMRMSSVLGEVVISETALKPGDKVEFFGYSASFSAIKMKPSITFKYSAVPPVDARTVNTAYHTEYLGVDQKMSQTVGGVLLHEEWKKTEAEGEPVEAAAFQMRTLWPFDKKYHLENVIVPADVVRPVIDAFRSVCKDSGETENGVGAARKKRKMDGDAERTEDAPQQGDIAGRPKQTHCDWCGRLCSPFLACPSPGPTEGGGGGDLMGGVGMEVDSCADGDGGAASVVPSSSPPPTWLDVESLPIEFETIPLWRADSGFRLPKEWTEPIAAKCGKENEFEVLMVRRVFPFADAKVNAQQGEAPLGDVGFGRGKKKDVGIAPGDLLLAIEEEGTSEEKKKSGEAERQKGTKPEPVVRFSEMLSKSAKVVARSSDSTLEDSSSSSSFSGKTKTGRRVQATIFRKRTQVESTVSLGLQKMSGTGTSRVIIWAGFVIQEAHPGLMRHGFLPKQLEARGVPGVILASQLAGSPAELMETRDEEVRVTFPSWILWANGKEVYTLPDFIEAVRTPLKENSDPNEGVVQNGGNAMDGSAASSEEGVSRVKTMSIDGKVTVFALRGDLWYWPTVDARRKSGGGGWSFSVVSESKGLLCGECGQKAAASRPQAWQKFRQMEAERLAREMGGGAVGVDEMDVQDDDDGLQRQREEDGGGAEEMEPELGSGSPEVDRASEAVEGEEGASD
uniref:PDZ-like domain-containing protein n=1 Tax=Chromera velia CCMP2878 TaxID=1169474 RepID=A0A0G4HJJ2_9ALVE|eukprot:Cvel_7127.t1-p1 / transcript=Cvel_7127.t1 / gene=Cvel_7127 / organism=Chromera_velia_CCMP2878 / gene_product=Protease Do-like 7, putative / transcript_product=Protease Do-like 7, putative / location=Cvel_scaffold366:706-7280(+) / protein_length=1343 / sequence_SO=supercontig / SO=protein_coding / is_pseudo=false